MAERQLAAGDDTTESTPEQDPKVGTLQITFKVPAPVHREITRTADREGFESWAECIRSVMKVWARDAEVRDLVRSRMHLAVLDPATDSAA